MPTAIKPTIASVARKEHAIAVKRQHRDRLARLAEVSKSEHWRDLKAHLQSVSVGVSARIEANLNDLDENLDPVKEYAILKFWAGHKALAENLLSELEDTSRHLEQLDEQLASMEAQLKTSRESLAEAT